MRIQEIEIKNFRGLQDVHVRIDKLVNVLIGTNAIGKSTFLEAMRLAKTVLAPRYYGEGNAALVSLGVLNPHWQQPGGSGIDFSSIAGDFTRDVVIRVKIKLQSTELNHLDLNVEGIALTVMATEMLKPDDNSNQLAFTQFLSTDVGRNKLKDAKEDVQAKLKVLRATALVELRLTFDHRNKQVSGFDAFGQTLLIALDRFRPPNKTILTYYPADRTFPQGDVVVQLGAADMQNQIQAHLGIPASKYARLKITIAQSMLVQDAESQLIKKEFDLVFNEILPGKEFDSVKLSSIGSIRVLIKDQKRGSTFDIDGMSSGEKGLLLTLVSIRQSVDRGGIVLLDEPELHLNPTITRNIIPFIEQHICSDRDIQVFICTHSAELATYAYEKDNCSLFHLRSGTDLSPILLQDKEQMKDVLSRLGVSASQMILSGGNIFVEGEHDQDLLAEGFAEIVGNFNILPLGGRQEIEKEIAKLSEASTESDKKTLFVLDHDRKPIKTPHHSSVRVLQWERYCLENYFIDDDAFFDTVTEFSVRKPETRASFAKSVKEAALSQLLPVVVQTVYKKTGFADLNVRAKDLVGSEPDQIIQKLCDKLSVIKNEITTLDVDGWRSKFKFEFDAEMTARLPEWEIGYVKLCNGKQLIDTIYELFGVRQDKLNFKKKLIRQMRIGKSDNWQLIQGRLQTSIA